MRKARTTKRALLQGLQTQRGLLLVDALAASHPLCLSVAQLLCVQQRPLLPRSARSAAEATTVKRLRRERAGRRRAVATEAVRQVPK